MISSLLQKTLSNRYISIAALTILATAAMPLVGNCTPTQVKNSTVHSKSIASQAAFLSGTWEGTYVCRQGLTRLKLVIKAQSETDIDAVFLFSAHPNNPSVPSGSFRMKGSFESFNSPDIPNLLSLDGTSWIDGSSGYETVDLKGNISSSKRKITGNITTPGCSTFSVVKRGR
jgi:hypothetical protein